MNLLRFSTLYHLTSLSNAEQLLRHGLFCAADLIQRADLTEQEKERLLCEHRPSSVEVSIPELGLVELRDQKKLDVGVLRKRLTEMTVTDYIRALNERVFFWPRPEKVEKMLPAYAHLDCVVLHIRTADLVRDYGERIQVSICNSGYAHARTRETFRREKIFFDLDSPLPEGFQPVEVVIRGSVPNLADYICGRRDVPCRMRARRCI